MHILNNEISTEYKLAFEKNEVNFKLVSPYDHRCNIAEKSVQISNDNFVSILCGTGIKFPLQLWDIILPQAGHATQPDAQVKGGLQ